MSGYNCKIVNSKVCVIEDPTEDDCMKCKVPDIYNGINPNAIKYVPRKLTAEDIYNHLMGDSLTFRRMGMDQQGEVVKKFLEMQDEMKK